MKNTIFFGDNLPILKNFPSSSVDLIYIDPPFNTGKTQKRKTIKTIKDENGDRIGFQGNSYKTIELGTKEYEDSFNFDISENLPEDLDKAYRTIAPYSSKYFIEEFLKPRLLEAYRILSPHGCLYFHIDYRESHYCKILLDNIFGRESFQNEIIWAYDFGGRARSKWPPKHDNILFYVKDPKNYIFNPSESDREEYMAPGLVGPEKSKLGKLPTDTWFWGYVGKKGMKNSDTWWMTIVGTNSKERIGYPTQKPLKLINRIIQTSTLPGNVVMDFFAGSGTVGESCIINDRKFVLIDNNNEALEVMAKRFANNTDIEWVNFNPKPFQSSEISVSIPINGNPMEYPIITPGFQMLASTAASIQSEWEQTADLWKNSPFEWIVQLPARSKGKLARRLISSFFVSKGLIVDKEKNSSETIIIEKVRYAIKFSTLWTNHIYQFQQIKAGGPEKIICFGISPFSAHCWIIDRNDAIRYGNEQHRGANGAEYWLSIDPENPPTWLEKFGGPLEKAIAVIKNKAI